MGSTDTEADKKSQADTVEGATTKKLSCSWMINEHSAFYEWRCQMFIAGSPCTAAYLIDSREERHKLAEHSCTDTGYVNKGTLIHKNSTVER